MRGGWFADRRTGGIRRHVGFGLPAVPPDDVDVTAHEPPVGRGRLRALPHQVRTSERERRSHSGDRSEEHTSELQSPCNLVCRLLLEKKRKVKDRTKRRISQRQVSRE